MIDADLTRKRLGTTHRRNDSRVKRDYLRRDYVIVRCDSCESVFGTSHGTVYYTVLKARQRNKGKDICPSCQRPLRNFDNARDEFLRIVHSNDGEVPRRDDLPNNLIGAINRYHVGYRVFLERCGFEPKTKAAGYWKQWSNVESELRPICDDLGFFPPDQHLLAVNVSLRGSLRNFGGVVKVAKRMGLTLGTGYEADDGHFVLSYYEFAVDNILFAYRISHETFPLIVPGDRRRGDFKVGDTFIEVAGYARRMNSNRYRDYHQRLQDKLTLYRQQNFPIIVIYREDFDDISRVLRKLKPLITRYADSTTNVDIRNAIRPVSWWADWDNLESVLRPIVEELGHFPTARELEQSANSSVAHYIMKFHGGFSTARRCFGEVVRQESPGYFSEWAKIEETFLPICKQLGYFPSPKEIRGRKFGVTDCTTSLYKYWGSFKAIATRLGYPTKRQFEMSNRRNSGNFPRRKPEGELPSRQISKKCAHCASEFLGRRHSKYCCCECYWAARRSIEIHICPICGQRFRPVANHVLTCSRSCGQRWRKRSRKAK